MTIRMHAGLALEMRGVRVAFVERDSVTRIVLDVRTFHVDGGTQLAVCGPSGSGKTTLIHLLAGLVRSDRGTVRWGEIELTALPERIADLWRRETVGLVFRQAHLFAGMSALDNVLLPLRFDRWSVGPAQRARAHKLLERVGVRPDAHAACLSNGEQQRVAVARAVLRKPAIVLADEPTASLDRESANAVADLLCSMCRGIGATLVLATHDRSLARRLDRALAIVEGDLQESVPAPLVPPTRTPDGFDRRLATVA